MFSEVFSAFFFCVESRSFGTQDPLADPQLYGQRGLGVGRRHWSLQRRLGQAQSRNIRVWFWQDSKNTKKNRRKFVRIFPVASFFRFFFLNYIGFWVARKSQVTKQWHAGRRKRWWPWILWQPPVWRTGRPTVTRRTWKCSRLRTFFSSAAGARFLSWG